MKYNFVGQENVFKVSKIGLHLSAFQLQLLSQFLYYRGCQEETELDYETSGLHHYVAVNRIN